MKSCCKTIVAVSVTAAALAAVYFFVPGIKPHKMTEPITGIKPHRTTEAITRIGIIDMEALFLAYRKTTEFHKEAQSIQVEFMKAQESGENEKLFALQQKFQMMQMELFQTFEADVAKTAALLSDKTNVDLIATNIIYRGDKTEVVDITGDFLGTEHFAEDIPEPDFQL